MFEWVPVIYYTNIYYITLFIVVAIIFTKCYITPIHSVDNKRFTNTIGLGFLVFVIVYMGLRPVNGVFIDMTMYDYNFRRFQQDGLKYINSTDDLMFNYFTYVSSKIMTASFYFLICSILYIVPLYLISKKWFKNYWFYSFLALVASFSFWSYGVNGIRNGIATSMFLLAVSRERLGWKLFWLIVAVNFHKTVLLPSVAFFVACICPQPKYFLFFWLLCIPMSLLLGNNIQVLFAGVMNDTRAVDYLTNRNINGDQFSSTGFRWDFLIYSGCAVFAGWYYLYRLNYDDKFYRILYNTYLFSNAFWILVIKANFSNRFAYLSWFLMAIIIFYPIIKHLVLPFQHRVIGYLLFAYFAFTFFMNVIIAN
ncbi:EpsG family protein [Desertivirga xinjiangensis]|uniref:EpsG family protein n=1 Tax=Desertivirga xinjiangensis TaxID=539206 RepID=UPI0034E21E12